MKPRFECLISSISCSLTISLPLAICIEALSNLQTVHMILNLSNQSETNQDLSLKTIKYICSLLSGHILLGLNNLDHIIIEMVWICFACYLTLLVLLVISLFIFNPINSEQKGKPQKVVAAVFIVHSRILFFIIHYFFMEVLSSKKSWKYADNMTFPSQSVGLGLSILFCFINFGIGFTKEFHLYDINKNKKNAYAIKDNLFHQIIFLYKTLATILFFLPASSLTNGIVLVANLIFAILAMVILFVKLPFYNLTVLKTSLVTIGTLLSFSIISNITIFQIEERILTGILAALIPLVLKCLLILFNRLSDRIMQSQYWSPAKAIYFVTLLEQNDFGYSPNLLYNRNEPHIGRVMCKGILMQNTKALDEINSFKCKKEYEKKIYSFIVEKLTYVLEKHPDSRVLLLFMAQIYLKKLGNIPKAVSLIDRVQSKSCSITTKNSIDVFNKKLARLNLKNNMNYDDQLLDVSYYFQERNLSNSIKENLQHEVNNHLEFWKEIRKSNVCVKKVMVLARQIDIDFEKIQSKMQKELLGPRQHFLNSLIMHGVYFKVLKEQNNEARRVLRQYRNLSQYSYDNKSKYDVHFEESAAIVISLEKSNFGTILDASGSLQTIFCTNKENFIGKSVVILFPSIVGEDLLLRFQSYSRNLIENLNTNYKSFAKSAGGNFFEVEIQLKLYIEVNREIKMMMFLKKLSNPMSIIIIDDQGLIVDYSENLNKGNLIGQTKRLNSLDIEKIVPTSRGVSLLHNQQPFSHDIYQRYNGSNTTSISTYQQLITTDRMRQENFDEILGNEFLKGNRIAFEKRDIDKAIEQKAQILSLQIDDKIYKVIVLKEHIENNFSLRKFSKATSSLITPIHTSNNNVSKIVEVHEEKESKHTKQLLDVTNSNARNGFYNKRILSHLGQEEFIKPSKKLRDQSPKHQIKDEDDSPRFNILQQKSQTNQEPEGSISSNVLRRIDSTLTLKALIAKPDSYPLARITGIALLLLMILMITFGAINFFLTRSATNQVKSGVEIINEASLRLSQAIRGWQTSSRFFLRKTQLRNASLLQVIRDEVYSNGFDMIQYNKELTEKFSTSQIDQKFLRKIHSNTILLWDLYQDKPLVDDKVDTFLATNLLGHKMMLLANTTGEILPTTVLDPVQFVINNTANDYLISSEEVITTTQEILQSLIKDNISQLKIVLGFEITALVMVCFCLIYAGRKVICSYQILFEVLVKIDGNHISLRINQLQRVRSLLLEDLETLKFKQQALEILALDEKENTKEMSGTTKKEARRKNEQQITKKGVLIDIAKHIGFSLIIVQILIVLFILSLSDSFKNFQSLNTVNNQLAVTTRAAYKINSVMSTFFVEIIWRNDTSMLVKNTLPRYQLTKDIEAVSYINNDLISVFSIADSGITDPIIKEILQGEVCKFLPSGVQDYCQSATANGLIGLLSINSQLIMTEEFYTRLYLDNPTYDTAKSIIDPYLLIMRPCVDTLDEAYRFLNHHILETLDQNLEDFLFKATLFHLSILLAIVFSVFAVKKLGIDELKSIDVCRGQILRVLPLKIYLEDRIITFYLHKNFKITKKVLGLSQN